MKNLNEIIKKTKKAQAIDNAFLILKHWNISFQDRAIKYNEISLQVRAKMKSIKKYPAEKVSVAIDRLKTIIENEKKEYWAYNKPTFEEFMLGFTKLSVSKLVDPEYEKYKNNFVVKKTKELTEKEKKNIELYQQEGLRYPMEES